MAKRAGLGTFAIDVEKFGRKAVADSRQAVRWIVLELLRRVVIKTPVGNPSLWKPLPSGRARKPPSGYAGGRLRGNWQTTVGAPATGEIGLRDEGVAPRSAPRGMLTVGEAVLTTQAWDADGSAFIVNNLPYAEAVEDGHSTQAPVGMVKITLTEFPGVVERSARRARARR